MPVEKLKTFEAAERAVWCFKPDREYYRRVSAHFSLGSRLYKGVSVKGVHKYRSIAERNRLEGRS